MKIPLVAALLCASLHCQAATFNGNDFALALAEAKSPDQKKTLLDEARKSPHYFRYLKIDEIEEVAEEGRTGIRIKAIEPASLLRVVFTVTLSNSIAVLHSDPESKVGDAIAVTGKPAGFESDRNAILLDSPIVRQKDRLSPKAGKELLSETNPAATIYSYTEGPRPINVEARDKDLLESRDRILSEGGPMAWFEFLETEIAKRKRERAAKAAPQDKAP
jgi:hypothetical protein